MIAKGIMVVWTVFIVGAFFYGLAAADAELDRFAAELARRELNAQRLALQRLGITTDGLFGMAAMASAFLHFGVWLIIAVPTYMFHMMFRQEEAAPVLRRQPTSWRAAE
jgi:hypothetical protein